MGTESAMGVRNRNVPTFAAGNAIVRSHQERNLSCSVC